VEAGGQARTTSKPLGCCISASQRKESFTTTRFLEVQLQFLNLKLAVARKQKQEPARQNGPS
jgi:hypothetical protein